MQSVLRAVQFIAFLAGTWLGGSACLAAEAGTPQRVLIIHSFGRDFAPYDAATAAFRHELASQAANPIIFLEATLDAGRTIDAVEEAAFVSYLKARFANPQPPDLIVTIGPPAGQFVLKSRSALFPSTPAILTALDSRLVPVQKLKAGDALIATKLDFPRFLKAILGVLPDTKTVAVVVGDSTLEKFWRRELEQESAFLSNRVRFLWFDGLSLQQMKEEVAALPADSVIFYGMFIVDAAGIPHERLDALAEIKGVLVPRSFLSSRVNSVTASSAAPISPNRVPDGRQRMQRCAACLQPAPPPSRRSRPLAWNGRHMTGANWRGGRSTSRDYRPTAKSGSEHRRCGSNIAQESSPH